MPESTIVFGLGFGDEGKGATVDFLCRAKKADLVIRFNGGSQAAHNAVTPEGKHFTFSQFGSGTFVGAKTLISQYMYCDPISLIEEAKALSKVTGNSLTDLLSRHFIDGRSPIITPFHVAANRIREWKRGQNRHGSCGKGHGETVSDYMFYDGILAEDLSDVRGLLHVQERMRDSLSLLDDAIDSPVGKALPDEVNLLMKKEHAHDIAQLYHTIDNYVNVITPDESGEMIRKSNVVFEGAQGVLLDELHGFHPYTTWSSTTPKNAFALLKESDFKGKVECLGVTRTYQTRHGNGPFPSEDDECVILPNEHNALNDWQGSFKTGHLDLPLLGYAAECAKFYGKLDGIVVTHMDTVNESTRVVVAYDETFDDEGRYEYTSWLKADKNTTLEKQEQIGNKLSKIEFPYVEFCDERDIIDYIEGATKVSVKITCHGPTSATTKILEEIPSV